MKNTNSKNTKRFNVYKTYDGGNTKYSLKEDSSHSWMEELSDLKEGDHFFVVEGQCRHDWDFDDTLYEKPTYEEIEEYFSDMYERHKEGYDDDVEEEEIKEDFLEYCYIEETEYVIDSNEEEGFAIWASETYRPTDE